MSYLCKRLRIVDQVLNRWSGSYPGAEKLWALPGPSLRYVPDGMVA